MRILICAFAFFLSISTHASESVLRHLIDTSQAMSSLYMKALSQGSDRYDKDFRQYKQNAMASLQQIKQDDKDLFDQLRARWSTFADKLELTFTQDFGWDIDSGIRRDFRAYLSDVYERVNSNAHNLDSENLKRLFASAQVEAMVARFFDIASTYNGTFSLSLSDAEKLDIQHANQSFKTVLQELGNQLHSNKEVKTVERKWQFVEKNVTGESSQGAFFLVYATKKRISNLLLPSDNMTATSDF